MKYGKIISKILNRRDNNNGMVAVALVAGLAAGAVISILFAPESGADTRRAIGDKAKGLGNGIKDSYSSLKDRVFGVDEVVEPAVAPEVPHFVHTTQKRKKSDIKELINEFHNGEHHNEQPI
ncbi:YtxH domain-containing protein [Pedobacter frigiditerrae]|uniref:YtxH domain-containing protein n=1 Tax=Pedobacter frigiditerrae TaxID=2530452 RepID=A0A4R0N523_9SPHI|nr:YtxH domain-containing protein [Pedobacter frigiditerrae]TCC94487.1 YtxH domain-containing protein [Pedobacter frigiditerrae]